MTLKIGSYSDAMKAIRAFMVFGENGTHVATIYENGVMLLAGKAEPAGVAA